ncbi:MAG: PilZ domain-containing protein [Bacteroidota bacterium]|nr:PilZ domain-containing protein [Kiloniellaceae bacterium]
MTGSLAPRDRSQADNRREWPRYHADRDFSLSVSVGGRLLPCRVTDISLGGARLLFDTEPPPAAGEAIALSHPDSRPVACARVWQEGPEIGVEFDFSEESLGLISICIRNMVAMAQQPQVAEA